VSEAAADAVRIAETLGSEIALRVLTEHGEVTVEIAVAGIADALALARDEGYDFLVDLAATDYSDYASEGVGGYWGSPDGQGRRDINLYGTGGLAVVPILPGSKRFAISYQLLAREATPPRRLRLRTWVGDGEEVPTAVPVFPAADYQEREAYDLMGIPFAGHPNLERIFLPEGWDGHPHRKDYPIGGEPVQFSDQT
jgi:NADH:ubiquinone oxidoreductase subunit C